MCTFATRYNNDTSMSKNLTIIDKDYAQWIEALSVRYRQSQIRAAVKVNSEMLKYYWDLGRDIVELNAEKRWGEKVMSRLSKDLREAMPDSKCFSMTNLLYMKNFYRLYNSVFESTPQAGEQTTAQITPQVGEQLKDYIFSVPWGHHKLLIDKCRDNVEKAIYYVRQTVDNGWSRSMLLEFINAETYERQGKAITNFQKTLPDVDSELAQELTKDPYDFAFTGITKPYNERVLKDALLNNITRFLTELGTGFAYVGKEYRLQIGQKEKFIDLLFYNLNLSCYVVIEVKIGEFDFQDLGQLSGYVVACNHILKKEGRDNPTIGLLICRQKDSLLAQYALEGSNLPLGISEYELSKLYPENVEGTIPTIEEIEAKLSN